MLLLLRSTPLESLICANRGTLDRVEKGIVEKPETSTSQTSVVVATTQQLDCKIILGTHNMNSHEMEDGEEGRERNGDDLGFGCDWLGPRICVTTVTANG